VGRSPASFEDGGSQLTLYNRLSDYINALFTAGVRCGTHGEETDKDTLDRELVFTSRHYAPCKAKHFPLPFIVKTRKL